MTDAPEVLEGVLEVRPTGGHSRSAMLSTLLRPDHGDPIVLHRRQAVALDAEPELAVYAGRRVRVTGTRGWSSFVVDQVEVIPDEG